MFQQEPEEPSRALPVPARCHPFHARNREAAHKSDAMKYRKWALSIADRTLDYQALAEHTSDYDQSPENYNQTSEDIRLHQVLKEVKWKRTMKAVNQEIRDTASILKAKQELLAILAGEHPDIGLDSFENHPMEEETKDVADEVNNSMLKAEALFNMLHSPMKHGTLGVFTKSTMQEPIAMESHEAEVDLSWELENVDIENYFYHVPFELEDPSDEESSTSSSETDSDTESDDEDPIDPVEVEDQDQVEVKDCVEDEDHLDVERFIAATINQDQSDEHECLSATRSHIPGMTPNTFIADTGASSHMGPSAEGMINLCTTLKAGWPF